MELITLGSVRSRDHVLQSRENAWLYNHVLEWTRNHTTMSTTTQIINEETPWMFSRVLTTMSKSAVTAITKATTDVNVCPGCWPILVYCRQHRSLRLLQLNRKKWKLLLINKGSAGFHYSKINIQETKLLNTFQSGTLMAFRDVSGRRDVTKLWLLKGGDESGWLTDRLMSIKMLKLQKGIFF